MSSEPDVPKETGGIESQSVGSVRFKLKVLNLFNAAFLVVGGVLAFVTNSSPSLPLVLSAIYVIMFAMLLIFYEMSLSFLDRAMAHYFGFMFDWKGRLIFFIFIGTLSFGIGDVGIAAGAFTVLVCLINIYVMCKHPLLKQDTQTDESKRASAALQDVRVEVAGDTLTPQQKLAMASAAVNVASTVAAKVPADQWEKLYDEQTNKHYFHNAATGETRWEQP